MSDSLEKLAKSSSQICKSIMQLVNFPKARLAKEDRLMIHRIMVTFNIDRINMTDRQKCEVIETHYLHVLTQIQNVERIERESGGRMVFPNVKKILLTILFAYGATVMPVCSADAQQCTMRVATVDGNPLGYGRVFINGDIRPEVSQMGNSTELIQEAKQHIYKHRRPGHQMLPVATFLLGGSGAGKSTSFENILTHNKQFQEGVSGALLFNTDEIMEELPGYKGMMDLGTLDNRIVSNQMAADIYHEPAEEIGDTLLMEAINNHESFIFDGTGNNFRKLQSRFKDLKSRGYQINVIVVTADTHLRIERVEKRSIQTGRWVPPEVVAKGRTLEEWQFVLNESVQNGIVDNFEIVQNN